LLETFILFDELSEWLFNFIEEMEESDPKNTEQALFTFSTTSWGEK